MALIIGVWFVLQEFLKVLNLRVLLPPSRLALIIGAWFVLQYISKSSEFASVDSAFEVGFDYWGLVRRNSL